MASLSDFEKTLPAFSRGEKAQILKWVVRSSFSRRLADTKQTPASPPAPYSTVSPSARLLHFTILRSRTAML